MSGKIYQGLLDRGLPPHVAEAFMDSFQAESGLNPSINEVSPLVEGSRGGRGLYQLTGPRRTAYEAEYGTGYDVDSQLDWLMHELQGPEANAAKAIMATGNREDAVRAITSKFLRPAHDNSEARIGSWSPDGQPTRKAGLNQKASKANADSKDYEYEYTGPKMGEKLHAGLHDKLGGNERAGKRMVGIGGVLAQLGENLLKDA